MRGDPQLASDSAGCACIVTAQDQGAHTHALERIEAAARVASRFIAQFKIAQDLVILRKRGHRLALMLQTLDTLRNIACRRSGTFRRTPTKSGRASTAPTSPRPGMTETSRASGIATP